MLVIMSIVVWGVVYVVLVILIFLRWIGIVVVGVLLSVQPEPIVTKNLGCVFLLLFWPGG